MERNCHLLRIRHPSRTLCPGLLARAVVGAICLLLSFVSSAAALDSEGFELRVFDRSGLARLVAQVHGPEAIEVRLGSVAAEESWILVHVDGLSPNVHGQLREGTLVFFPKVPPGTWRLSQVPRKNAGGAVSPTKITDIKLAAERE